MICIELPWPDPALHVHAKGVHWAKKAGATKAARRLAERRARLAMQTRKHSVLAGDPVMLCYGFIMPDRRGRDIENLRGMCKPYVDGVVDAGLLVDDNWQRLMSGPAFVRVCDRKADEVAFVRVVLVPWDDSAADSLRLLVGLRELVLRPTLVN